MARSRATGRAKKQHSTAKNAKAAIVCSVCGKGDGKYKCPKCRSPFCCVQCSKDHKANHCPATKSIETGHDDDVSKQQSNTSLAAATTTAAAINTTSNEPQSKYLPAAAFAQASSTSSSSQPKKKRMRRSNDDDDSDNDEPGWNITEEMKQMIQHSEWLRKELEDGGLRHLIEQIDAASDVEEEEDDDGSNNNNNNRRKNWGRNTNKNGNTDISHRVLTLARTKHSHPKFATFIDRLLLTAGVLTDGGDGGGGGGDANLFENEGEVGRLELVPVPRRGGGELAAAAAAAAGKEEESSSDEEDSDSGSDSDDSDGSSAEE